MTTLVWWDYRGVPAYGLFDNGTWARAYTPGVGQSACPNVGVVTRQRCVLQQWPFAANAYDKARGQLQYPSWQGSLLRNKQDGTGLEYKRHRAYDPRSGRFTQEDPIGLAGGLNLYGYAGGDPVNFSDPFGLCPASMRDAFGNCPGGLSVGQWDRIVYAANNRMTPEARARTMAALNGGRIVLGFSWDTRMRQGFEGTSGATAAANRFRGQVEMGAGAFGLSSGDLAFVLAHEGEHLEQSAMGRGRTRELRADAYACANVRDRDLTKSGATQGATCGAERK